MKRLIKNNAMLYEDVPHRKHIKGGFPGFPSRHFCPVKQPSDPDPETNYSRQVVFEFMCSENEKGRLGEMGARGAREMVNVSYGCKYTVKKRIHEDGC